ncbi:hypothetical protein BJY52DRAFT_1264689 [Lactarius psammicola]|nr:hypothetical protein BJY52DRAFT_1264689 [Lactarius psammicola]
MRRGSRLPRDRAGQLELHALLLLSLRRTLSPSAQPPVPLSSSFFRDVAGGLGVSPARGSTIHCGGPVAWARVVRKNARKHYARAVCERVTDAPVVTCARRRERAQLDIDLVLNGRGRGERVKRRPASTVDPPPIFLSLRSSSCLGNLFVRDVYVREGEGKGER